MFAFAVHCIAQCILKPVKLRAFTNKATCTFLLSSCIANVLKEKKGEGEAKYCLH